MTTSTSATTTANLLYNSEPEVGVRAYQYVNIDPITGQQKCKFGREYKGVVNENLHGEEDSVTLDIAGFQYFRHKSKRTSFSNDEEIYQQYYPESIDLIKSLTGTSRAVLFDHTKSSSTSSYIAIYFTIYLFLQAFVAVVLTSWTMVLITVNRWLRYMSTKTTSPRSRVFTDIFRPPMFQNSLKAASR